MTRGARDALVQSVEDGKEVVGVHSHDAGVELRSDALKLIKVGQLGAQRLGKLHQPLLLLHQALAALVQRSGLCTHIPVLRLQGVKPPERAVHLLSRSASTKC